MKHPVPLSTCLEPKLHHEYGRRVQPMLGTTGCIIGRPIDQLHSRTVPVLFVDVLRGTAVFHHLRRGISAANTRMPNSRRTAVWHMHG